MWQLKKAYYRAFQKIMKIAMYAFDWSEPELLEGPGAIDRLPALIKSKGLRRVLIVTDQGLMSLHILDGLFDTGAGLLPLAGVQPVELDGLVLGRADILGNHVKLGDGNEKLVVARIINLYIVYNIEYE